MKVNYSDDFGKNIIQWFKKKILNKESESANKILKCHSESRKSRDEESQSNSKSRFFSNV
jgi:hypothetical protein